MFSKKISKGRPQRSFALELNLQYTLYFVLAASILFYVAYKNIYTYVRHSDELVVRQRLAEYKDWYEGGGVTRLNQRFRSASRHEQEGYFIKITDPNGSVLFLSEPSTMDAPKTWAIAQQTLSEGRIITVGKSADDSQRLLSQMRNVFILTMFGSAILVFSGGVYTTRQAFKPIRRMTEVVRNIISTGKFDERVPARKRPDELDNLAVLFNTMLDRNQNLIRGMREALDNVAHDLRTPMTRLRASMETGLQSGDDLPRMREALSDGIEESDRLLTILKVLMDVSEAEAGMLKLHTTTFNARTLVTRVMDLYELVAEEAQVTLRSESLIDTDITADQPRLGQVLVNLVDNAIKYTPQGGTVTVAMQLDSDSLTFTVTDTGMGIPTEEQPKIWQRLYRCDASRSRKGLGLGLCMAKIVVEAHGGNVDLTSEVGKGSCFSVHLPRG